MGSGGGSANTVAEFKPPSYTTGLWQDYVNQAANLTSQAPTMWQGPRIADLTPQTYQGLDMITQTAMNSSPDVLAARGQVTDTANGAYLGANPYANSPYWDKVIANNAQNMGDAFAAGTAAQNAGLANMQGAFGGSSYALKQAADAQGMAKNVGQMADQARLNQAQLGSGTWEAERQRQLAAAGQGYGGQALDLQAGQALAGVGDVQRAYQQNMIDTMYNTWKEGQMSPFQNLDILRNALTAASGGMGTNTTYSNAGGFSPLAGLLGAGAMGYGLYTGLK